MNLKNERKQLFFFYQLASNNDYTCHSRDNIQRKNPFQWIKRKKPKRNVEADIDNGENHNNAFLQQKRHKKILLITREISFKIRFFPSKDGEFPNEITNPLAVKELTAFYSNVVLFVFTVEDLFPSLCVCVCIQCFKLPLWLFFKWIYF